MKIVQMTLTKLTNELQVRLIELEYGFEVTTDVEKFNKIMIDASIKTDRHKRVREKFEEHNELLTGYCSDNNCSKKKDLDDMLNIMELIKK